MDVREKIRQKVLDALDLSREYSDEEIQDMISEMVTEEAKSSRLSVADRIHMEKEIFNSLRKLDVIQVLIDDPQITEIMVNGPDQIFYEKEGRIYPYEGKFSSEEKLMDIIQTIVGGHNRVVNQSTPIVDTRLADGSRVNIVLSPVSIDGTAISIRKFPKKPLDMEKLIRLGAINREAVDFLETLVKARYSIMVSGGTGSGKTTFLNALSQYIPAEERIITIEDSAELQLLSAENLVRLETRNANLDGVKAISIRDLIRTALRMRPDRIIVGECRGEEALDMLTAMNTGHDGSLSTGHSNSCRDMLSRLETMVITGKEMPLAVVRKQIASGVDLIVHLGRLRDKSRKVLEIAEIDGVEDGEITMHTIYRFEETETDPEDKERDTVRGKIIACGKLRNREKLRLAGLEGALPDGL